MQVIVKHDVNKCIDCPHFQASMDGPYCPKLYANKPSTYGAVYPEGRNKIHPNCPLA